jgi:acetolactate synthase small subunit
MVQNLSEADSLTLELAIIKLNKAKTDVESLLENYEFERKILDEKDNYTVFKVLGDTQEIEKLLSELKKEEFLEVTRSGTLGMTKGNESLATNDQTKISYD